MAKYTSVFQNEKYMDDAVSSILANLLKGRQKKHLSIWESDDEIPTSWENSNDSVQSKRSMMFEKALSDVNDSTSTSKVRKGNGNEKEFVYEVKAPYNNEGDRRPPKSCCRREDQNFKRTVLQNDQTIEKDRMVIKKHVTNEVQSNVSEDFSTERSFEATNRSEFSDWCRKRNEEFTSRRSPNYQRLNRQFSQEHQSSTPKVPKENRNVKEFIYEIGAACNNEGDQRPLKSCCPTEDQNFKSHQMPEKDGMMMKKPIENEIQSNESEDFSKEGSFEATNRREFSDLCQKRNEEFTSRSSPVHQSMNRHFSREHRSDSSKSKKKRNRPKSKSPPPETHKLSRDPKKYSRSMSELDTRRNIMKTQICIKIADERGDKSEEFTVDFTDLSRIKRNFPKLNDILPDLDAENKTMQYSIEAVNIILRFVFCRRYNVDVMPNAAVGVEVLAASKEWEINEFHHIFHKDFLQKILPASNISFVFSQAFHYGLNEMYDACKEMVTDDMTVNHSTYKRKQKTCCITISTYIEPFEFSIPFHPMEKNLAISFERHILNTIRFQALSGSFTIIGIHIQLNKEHLENCSNLNMLKIDYSTKNITEDHEIGNGRHEKPLRPTNVIYFKEHLVVNPNQMVEITVETETKPYLCSAFPDEIAIKTQEKGRAFSLTVVSNFKVPNSSRCLYIVGKLLYYNAQKKIK